MFLDETEGTSKEDIPPWEDIDDDGGDEGASGSDDENDPPAKQCVLWCILPL